MGVSVDTGGKGGKKPLTADLNLVPYIDLLTCMVSFLLITAVWTHLARLEVKQKAQSTAATEETPPPEEQVKLSVTVSDTGFEVFENEERMELPLKSGEYDYAGLGSKLKTLKEAHPDKNDIQVASRDSIKFEILVRTMDTALAERFPDIALIDAAPPPEAAPAE